MLVVSEFVGCSPSLSGAIRVNPWSLEVAPHLWPHRFCKSSQVLSPHPNLLTESLHRNAGRV